jgi:hypothetical protein
VNRPLNVTISVRFQPPNAVRTIPFIATVYDGRYKYHWYARIFFFPNDTHWNVSPNIPEKDRGPIFQNLPINKSHYMYILPINSKKYIYILSLSLLDILNVDTSINVCKHELVAISCRR